MTTFAPYADQKWLGKSTLYKHVYLWEDPKNKIIRYMCSVLGVSKVFLVEREAALCADKILLRLGKEPVNILKRKMP